VISYESRKVTGIEQKCPIYDQELLVIIHAVKTWEPYLKNNNFEMVRDQKPLLSPCP
jgi:hypothetical protein